MATFFERYRGNNFLPYNWKNLTILLKTFGKEFTNFLDSYPGGDSFSEVD